MRSAERMIHVNGVPLCAQSFGVPGAPAVLLIGGAATSMDWWDEQFCALIASAGRFVIRYDTRDTGRSVVYPLGAPGYGVRDLVTDAIGLLDAFGVAAAHVVGVSMGGSIAQILGVRHPERIASLTLIATSPGGPGGPANPDLPPMTDRLGDLIGQSVPEPDWNDRDEVIDYLVEGQRPFAGSLPFDVERLRYTAGRVVDRTADLITALTNHWLIDGGEPVRSRLGRITAPTLVVHGSEDPLFPLGHAWALVREIPGARLLTLHGMGHQVPPRAVWPQLVPALLRHTAGPCGSGGGRRLVMTTGVTWRLDPREVRRVAVAGGR